MSKKPLLIAGLAAVLALGAAASGMLADAAGQDAQKPSAPRYSETCAHGHNGFNCEKSQYGKDIADLQKRTADLEERISKLDALS